MSTENRLTKFLYFYVDLVNDCRVIYSFYAVILESKDCSNFMADSNLFEYELQYGRKIIGEPRTIAFNDTLTFVCPKGTVPFERNELSYQCRM